MMLCDEVISALDIAVQVQVLRLLRDIQAKQGIGLIFITHDLQVLAHLAQDVIVLRKGRVVEAGPTLRILDAPEQDYARELVASMALLPDERTAQPLQRLA